MAKMIRRIFPVFFSLKIFGVGSLASSCEQHIGILDGLTKEKYGMVREILNKQIKGKSKQLKIPIVFIKEIPHHDL